MKVLCVVKSVKRMTETEYWRVALSTGKSEFEHFILTVPTSEVETFVLAMARGKMHVLEITIT